MQFKCVVADPQSAVTLSPRRCFKCASRCAQKYSMFDRETQLKCVVADPQSAVTLWPLFKVRVTLCSKIVHCLAGNAMEVCFRWSPIRGHSLVTLCSMLNVELRTGDHLRFFIWFLGRSFEPTALFISIFPLIETRIEDCSKNVASISVFSPPQLTRIALKSEEESGLGIIKFGRSWSPAAGTKYLGGPPHYAPHKTCTPRLRIILKFYWNLYCDFQLKTGEPIVG